MLYNGTKTDFTPGVFKQFSLTDDITKYKYILVAGQTNTELVCQTVSVDLFVTVKNFVMTATIWRTTAFEAPAYYAGCYFTLVDNKTITCCPIGSTSNLVITPIRIIGKNT